MKRAIAAVALLALAACTGTMEGGYPAYLASKGVTQPVTTESFPHCHGYGCRHLATIKLGPADWKALEKPLRSVHSAEEEREAVRRSVAAFERRVGALAGTAEDRGGTYVSVGDRQLDCVDESVNTTVYLALLEQRGKLKYHRTGTPTARLFLTSGALGPHQTAVMVEKESQAAFAVDSWFHDNGEMPEIVPLDEWIGGWRP